MSSSGIDVVAIDASQARRMAYSIVLWQGVTTGVVALLSWVVADGLAGISALIGGGISTLASFVMAFLSFRDADPERAVRGFYVGEAAKIAVVVVLFTLVLRTMKVSPLAMFLAYMATFLVYWIALVNALPPLTGRAR
jgi:ATP synthase protein I